MSIYLTLTPSRYKFYLYLLVNMAISLCVIFCVNVLLYRLGVSVYEKIHISGGVFLVSIITELRKDRIEEVIVDREKKILTINYYRPFVGKDSINFQFEELIYQMSSFNWFGKRTYTIIFEKKWGPMFRLNSLKDNFSSEMIVDINNKLKEEINK
ncbi:hypothetical protein NF867_01075 [Solitalea sp. MAHUQ-68]|uniref:Uncharacterized protein n=1 Tax=Solitalea agri TaxID=2953739 RepID=A0A9X2F468_9SPHI|nr:hypothetical protein [Solitalea agri]MCO4291453.1 hypothetical protein [Solitalea agri]